MRAKYDPSGGRGDIYSIAIFRADTTKYSIVISNQVGNDPDCTNLIIDNFGKKTHVGASPTPIRCWGSD